MIHNPDRAAEMRKTIDELSKRAKELREKVRHAGFQERLNELVDSFDEIEPIFFHDLGRTLRTPEQEARLFSYAIMAAAVAQFNLEQAEAQFAKYGPNLQTIG
jgi:hypothetical protein